ncbi:hypothetical protein DPMN_192038 [Dreissena polymorpha]|uniref:Uncharacterized protein n=1 Tax=Dreissena polymorpha TaxID=45954 RepID=A0A9D4BE08_DREPO|nr:hypothetical protein DPMN_192038 [Dreissena polymorpha]
MKNIPRYIVKNIIKHRNHARSYLSVNDHALKGVADSTITDRNVACFNNRAILDRDRNGRNVCDSQSSQFYLA